MNNDKILYIFFGIIFVSLTVAGILKFGNFEKSEEIPFDNTPIEYANIPEPTPDIPIAQLPNEKKVVDQKKDIITSVEKENILKIIFKGDFTSSGATRKYDASLTFKDNILVSGTETYFVGPGRCFSGESPSDCNRTDTCKILNQKWVDSATGDTCKIRQFVPLTLEEIKQKIDIKEINPISNCGHLNVCYEIISS